MKLLVCGGAGFIGSAFIRNYLINHTDSKIINLDILTIGSNLKNLHAVNDNPNYKFLKDDITNESAVNEIIKDVDLVINFAAESHVDRSISNPKPFINTNILGTYSILEAIRKYMPWSVSFFGNDRLVPLVEDLSKTIRVEDESVYMTYPIEQQLTQQVKASSQKLAEGESREIANSLKLLTEVIDVGVTHLIREPKKSLKFNFVVDKTLNGVINMTTHLGYKRLEKLGTQLDQQVAATYVDHFLKFMRHPA